MKHTCKSWRKGGAFPLRNVLYASDAFNVQLAQITWLEDHLLGAPDPKPSTSRQRSRSLRPWPVLYIVCFSCELISLEDNNLYKCIQKKSNSSGQPYQTPTRCSPWRVQWTQDLSTNWGGTRNPSLEGVDRESKPFPALCSFDNKMKKAG